MKNYVFKQSDRIKFIKLFCRFTYCTTIKNRNPETASHLILRMDKVPYIDQTGLYALEDILLDLESKEIYTLMIAPQKQPMMMLRKIYIVPDLVSEEHIFDNFQNCIKYINENVQNKLNSTVQQK